MSRTREFSISVVIAVLIIGCQRGQPAPEGKLPRPVSVLRLVESDPAVKNRVTGSVASWKTDSLGFEVSGRVQFVIEPESDIGGQLHDTKGNLLTEGTLLASLDPERYRLNVESFHAQIRSAEKQRDAAQIEVDRVIPAKEEAAQAQRDLAQTEVNRNTQLVASNAGAQRTLDLARANLDEAKASLTQLAASKEAKRADVAALAAQVEQLQQSLKDAERDVADCKLFSSFPGQVAQIHVIPGSFVNRAEPVVTVQMMDPIQVQFEVAAKTARQLNHRDQVRIYVPQSDGSTLNPLAFIYMIDPVADPLTRTFTVTLMLRNSKVAEELPRNSDGGEIGRTSLIAKALVRFAGLDTLFVNEECVHQNDTGHFLWKILNRRVGTLAGDSDRVLQVTKLRITPGERSISALGLADLREISIDEGQEFDPMNDMVTGRVVSADGKQPWTGDSVFFESNRWMLRPGDLVGVELTGEQTQRGYYVPLDAIVEKSGAHHVFVVDESPEGDHARQVEVTVHEAVDTLRRIESAGESPLATDSKIVAQGASFLVDGEAVNVAREVESMP